MSSLQQWPHVNHTNTQQFHARVLRPNIRKVKDNRRRAQMLVRDNLNSQTAAASVASLKQLGCTPVCGIILSQGE